LDSGEFLETNFRTLAAMLPSLDAAEAQQWATCDVKGIRIFGNLEILRPIVNHPAGAPTFPSEPIAFLSSVVVPPKPNLKQLGLATELIRILIDRSVASSEISLDLLTVLKRPDVREAVQRHSSLEGSSLDFHVTRLA